MIVNPCRTLVDTESKLGSDGDLTSDPTLYRSLAGALEYLTFTRPSLSYVVQEVTLSCSSAEAEHHGVANVVTEIVRIRKCEVHTCWGPAARSADRVKPVDQLEYSRAISYLMYAITSTRPNIAYAVGRLSRFTGNPSRHHWHAITMVFKYLKGTMNYGLSYVGYPSVLEGYSDASWINHVKDSSSTSGLVFLLGRGAISWAPKKQTCITGSTIESEFAALAAAGKEAERLRNLIHEIPIWPKQ
nr:zinc finger, CCHC-type [Tanacetum cinerariifolium]